jgi:ribosomal protein S18 acetylase RimI-like enzyme
MRMLLSRDTAIADPKLTSELMSVLDRESAFFRASYPSFDQWILQKVLPGISAGERTVIIEKRFNVAVALLIVKHTQVEQKICTLRVNPQYESKGLGVRLFEEAFEILQTSKPLLSVSETSKSKFTKLFKYFGFTEEAKYQGLYLPNANEYSYNGILNVFGDPTASQTQNNSDDRYVALPRSHLISPVIAPYMQTGAGNGKC